MLPPPPLFAQLLEDVVLVALRSNGMRRSHACFRNCYRRLYHVSKSYLKVHTHTHTHTLWGWQAAVHVYRAVKCHTVQ